MVFNSYQTSTELRLAYRTEPHSHLITSNIINPRRLIALAAVVALISSLALSSKTVEAAAGDLDPTFGRAGMVTTDFAGGVAEASASVIQPDGCIIAAGWSDNAKGASDFALARYNKDGQLDSSFGSRGKVTTVFGGNAKAYGIALQGDGKIVAAGFGKNKPESSSVDFAIARYNPDGSLDAAFGDSGKVTTDFFGKHDQVYAVAIQADRKIVVAGGATSVKNIFGFALARYNTDGKLDSTFGAGGKLITSFIPNQLSEAHALAIQSDGKIIAAGSGSPGFGMDFALVRYNPDGSLDQTFGTSGRTTTDFSGSEDQARALAIQPDGSIIAAGYAGLSNRPSTDFALARYKSNGALDPTFGSDGRVTTDFFDGYDGVSALALESDGLIVAAGMAGMGSGCDFGLARYRPNGTLDSTFGSHGKVNTVIQGATAWASSVAIQPDGKIVAAGNAMSRANSNNGFAIVRYGYEPIARGTAASTHPSGAGQ